MWIFLQTDYPSGDLSFLVLRNNGIARKLKPPSREAAQTVIYQFRRDVQPDGSAINAGRDVQPPGWAALLTLIQMDHQGITP
jgi:hypothetical protein